MQSNFGYRPSALGNRPEETPPSRWGAAKGLAGGVDLVIGE